MAQRISRAKQSIKASARASRRRRPTSVAGGLGAVHARALSHLQRGLRRQQRGPRAARASTCRARPCALTRMLHAAPPRGAGGGRPARAHAAHRCPARPRGPAPTASSFRSISRIARAGTGPPSREGVAPAHAGAAARRRWVPTSSRRRSRPSTTRRRAPEATDWPQILALYGVLRRFADNPMVALQPGHRAGHGARARRRTGRAGRPRRGPAPGRPPSPRRRRAAHLLERAGASASAPSTSVAPPSAPRASPERDTT